MSIADYLQTLLPNNEVSKITRSIRNLQNVIGKYTLPAGQALESVIDYQYKFKNRDMIQLNDFITKELSAKLKLKQQVRGANMVMTTVQLLGCLNENLSIVEDTVNKVFKGDNFSATTISYAKANILQYVEAADFFTKYARCLLNYVSSVELSDVQGVREVKGIAPNDLNLLRTGRFDFAKIGLVVALPQLKTQSAITKASDMIVTSDSNAAVNVVVGRSGTDPFGFSSLPFPMSLIFRMRMNSMDAGVDNYEAAKAEAQAVEYRVLLIKEHIQNGYGDAAVERSLDVQEDRLMKLKRKIEKLEEDYELN